MEINLANLNGRPPEGLDKGEIKRKTKQLISEINELQYKMHAQKKYSILLILQGMDASGKDGIVNSLFSKISPSGIKVVSFKKPTDEEFSHDFLWRIHRHMPQKGKIVIFNRSHYEDILVPSVYKYIDQEIIGQRYQHINQFEQMIADNNVKIIKCYLNVSPEKQKERLRERMELREKHWKHNDNDWKAVADRKKFEAIYEQIFVKCNAIKWNIIPSDKNWYKSYLVADALLDKLKEMDLVWPELDSDM